jgi:hypothetical protein
MAKLLRIPIERFKANKAILENLYLEFPLNKKSISILHSGDSLEADYLNKLCTKGVKYLCFSVPDSDTRDPNNCELYIRANEPSVSVESIVTHETILNAHQQAEVQLEVAPNVAIPAAIPVVANELQETIIRDIPEPSSDISFSKPKPVQEEIHSISPNDPAPEEEQRFSANELKENEPENRFSADRIKKDSTELRFSKSKEEAETSTIIRSSSTKKDEDEFRFTQGPVQEDLNEIAKLESKPSNEPDPFAKAKAKAKSLSHLKDLLMEGRTIDFPSSKDSLVTDLKSQVFGSKIEKLIINLLETPTDSDSNQEKLRDLELKLKKLKNGFISDEIEEEFSNSEEIGEFEKMIESSPVPVSEIMSTIQNIEEAKERTNKSLEEAYLIARSKSANTNQNSKDAAASLSKLAAYLGSAIGYSNVDFLAELGFGVVYQYQQRQGVVGSDDKLPPFTRRALLSSYSPNSLVDDYLNILKFLELYSSDPLVDFKEREFSKKIFDRTLERTKNAEFSPDPMSLSQWVAFVEKGPSMDVHSICSKASAKALKYVKDASN